MNCGRVNLELECYISRNPLEYFNNSTMTVTSPPNSHTLELKFEPVNLTDENSAVTEGSKFTTLLLERLKNKGSAQIVVSRNHYLIKDRKAFQRFEIDPTCLASLKKASLNILGKSLEISNEDPVINLKLKS